MRTEGDNLKQASLLVTGATGMVGAYAIAELLRHGVQVVALARSKGRISAEQRIDQLLKRFESYWNVALPRPVVLDSDLNAPRLGLKADQIRWITENCDRILHSAASLSFAPASQSEDNEPYRTNVEGTRSVLDFCIHAKISHFHHISTAYVCGKREGLVGEDELEMNQAFANDYEHSKVQAETLLRQARATNRLESLTVYRPSIVIDRTGLSPVSGDRTIYGTFSMYQMLASRFGLPDEGQWSENLGLSGTERKNIVDVDWISRAIRTILLDPSFHDQTYHLTTQDGTAVNELDSAFRIETETWLQRQSRPKLNRRTDAKLNDVAGKSKTNRQDEIDRKDLDRLAEPFVETFRPYFRDDPSFGRTHIDAVVAQTDLDQTPAIGTDELLEMIRHWSAPVPTKRKSVSQSVSTKTSVAASENQSSSDPDEIVICGYETRLPGGIENVADFKDVLWEGRSVISPMPNDRLDRSLYFDSRKGIPGKTYTELGGCVSPQPLCDQLEERIKSIGEFDLTHRQFAQVAMAAIQSTFGVACLSQVAGVDPKRAGVLVGHSGGTEKGGGLSMSTLAQSTAELLDQSSVFEELTGADNESDVRSDWKSKLTNAIRRDRPSCQPNGGPEYNAYSVASLVARLAGFEGRREVIDAACSSSLLALQHAATAIDADRLDIALVGGATFNNVDNLALFSQSGACSEDGCYPFDQRASGLISSEGYVAIVMVRRSLAEQLGLRIHGTLVGVGVASDGKGKGLWAPRSEGQQLAIRRAWAQHERPLDVDYLECHATSTQVGDATELESLTAVLGAANEKQASGLNPSSANQLPIGSAKSNLGHLLEAAGLVGMVKCLIGMEHGEIPESIHFDQPAENFDWAGAPVRVVDRRLPWVNRVNPGARVAAVNAFGIGGLNAHAVVKTTTRSTKSKSASRVRTITSSNPRNPKTDDAIAIVGRGVVLPGAGDISQFAELLSSGRSAIADPPTGRWVVPPNLSMLPHARGGYITDFQFDAQTYRIPPKTVRNANPAQLMLISAVSQAIGEFDGGEWSVDRNRVGVVIGTIFGGEFSNALQIGLRLPELRQHLIQIARHDGVSRKDAERLADQFHDVVMKHFPALLDETGGFTASTLASRIARTFNLMGGASAVDADEASGGLALLTAAEQLRAGNVDTVLCGVAQRAMDLVAWEQLFRKNHLVTSGRIEDVPKDASRIFPGEGVAIMMLQRHRDAVAQGKPIFGVIDGFQESLVANVSAARANDARNGKRFERTPGQLVSQIGHLGGGQGIVRTIANTIAFENRVASNSRPEKIAETAQDGYQIRYEVAASVTDQPSHTGLPKSEKVATAPKKTIPTENTKPLMHSAPTQSKPTSPAKPVVRRFVSVGGNADAIRTVRWEGSDPEVLRQDLQALIADPRATIHGEVESFGNQTDSSLDAARFQAAMVATSDEELSKIASKLLAGPVADLQTGALPQHAAWFRDQRQTGARIGWLFPGQGSQYADSPKMLCEESGFASATANLDFLRYFDDRLRLQGVPSVSDRLHDPQGHLGRDVWWTQLWVLAVGTMMTNSLLRRGHRPDVVLGHSFGECTAAWCAGVMSTDQAIRFAKLRSDAVVMTHQGDGQLLSVRSDPSAVHAILDQDSIDVVVSHYNSAMSTVVAGDKASITAAKERFDRSSIASVVIDVPAAFHTPAMRPAQELLQTRFASEKLSPPRTGFLSAVSNRYLAEPSDIRDNLVNQLTLPVCFHGAIERMCDDGCGLLIEVGPDDVLTRLSRSHATGKAICLSADDRRRHPMVQQNLIDLACEAFGSSTASNEARVNVADDRSMKKIEPTSIPATAPIQASAEPKKARFEVVDVTRRGRQQSNSQPSEHSTAPHTSRPATQTLKPFATQPPSNGKPVASKASVDLRENQQVATEKTATINSLAIGARAFLFDLVVDLTGYDPEIIDFEADLEGELGVDSIKKAQLIGEVIQWGDLEVDTTSMQLAQFETLNDILSLVADPAETQSDESIDCQAEAALNVDDEVPQNETSNDESELLRRLMIDLVVDQTGYDESIIDMDADLEGELGVDSIKKAQLLGELEQQYQLQSLRDSGLTLADFPTLESIHSFVWEQIVAMDPAMSVIQSSEEELSDEELSEKKNDPASELLSSQEAIRPRPSVPAEGTHRFGLRMRAEPRLRGMPQSPTFNGPALVVGSNAVADAIIQRWQSDETTSQWPITQIDSSTILLGTAGSTSDGSVVDLVKDPQTHGSLTRSTTSNDVPPMSSLDQRLDEIWNNGVSPHLFITTPHDDGADWETDDASAWQHRRDTALNIPYRICQRWMQGLIDEERMHEASLATLVQSGGHFGFGDSQGDESNDSISSESGGLAGLTKAMLIEAWMRGYRDTPMLVVDAIAGAAPDDFVDGVWRELAVPSYDEEVAVQGDERLATSAVYQPLRHASLYATAGSQALPGDPMNGRLPPAEQHSDEAGASDASRSQAGAWERGFGDGDRRKVSPLPQFESSSPNETRYPLTRGGVWIVAGGGRGITALTAMELAAKHGLKLHLLGTAPVPQIDETIRQHAAADRSELRRRVMKQIQAKGGNPVKAWQKLEKAIEIDQTLTACRDRGIEATYHSVDVSDPVAVDELVGTIRATDGPIRGVIQGAGAGQDSRFDRKRPDKVQKCFKAKIDGCVSLAAATISDPLEWFIGFGSISGRFGANGHTDYSAANDMLAKLIGNLGRKRPETRCLTFHWHAWGDIGMATKPEAKLALDMIGMKFMPAEEGLSHFMNELQFGGDLSEVLITDRRYVRKFFPTGERVAFDDGMPLTDCRHLPMLDPNGRRKPNKHLGEDPAYVVTLDPTRDRFLDEHRVQQRPTLPFVMALEMLCEAAVAESGQPVSAMHDVQAHQPLKCLTDDAFAVEVVKDPSFPSNRSTATRWSLVSDLRRRDGRLVQAARPHFSATVQTGLTNWSETDGAGNFDDVDDGPKLSASFATEESIDYLPPDAPVYHGPSLQCLRKIAFAQDQRSATGIIVAPSPAHLVGEDRPLTRWCLSPASMDAVLYAAGLLAYRVGGKPNLPISFERIDLGRLPSAGEPLIVNVQWDGDENGPIAGGRLSAELVGLNSDVILKLTGCRIGWLG